MKRLPNPALVAVERFSDLQRFAQVSITDNAGQIKPETDCQLHALFLTSKPTGPEPKFLGLILNAGCRGYPDFGNIVPVPSTNEADRVANDHLIIRRLI